MIIYLHGFDSNSPGNHEKVLQLQFIDPDVRLVRRDTKNAKTGQRKHEKTIFRILCVKPPKSGGFLSMV